MRELGMTKEGILGEMTNTIERCSKEEIEDFDDNEMLSDSDP